MRMIQIRTEPGKTEQEILQKAYEIFPQFNPKDSKFEEEEPTPGTKYRCLHFKGATPCITFEKFRKFKRFLGIKKDDDLMITVRSANEVTVDWFEHYSL